MFGADAVESAGDPGLEVGELDMNQGQANTSVLRIGQDDGLMHEVLAGLDVAGPSVSEHIGAWRLQAEHMNTLGRTLSWYDSWHPHLLQRYPSGQRRRAKYSMQACSVANLCWKLINEDTLYCFPMANLQKDFMLYISIVYLSSGCHAPCG